LKIFRHSVSGHENHSPSVTDAGFRGWDAHGSELQTHHRIRHEGLLSMFYGKNSSETERNIRVILT